MRKDTTDNYYQDHATNLMIDVIDMIAEAHVLTDHNLRERKLDEAKAKINQIKPEELGPGYHYESLWGISNGRFPGGKTSPTTLIVKHMIESGFKPHDCSSTTDLLNEICKQSSKNHPNYLTDLELAKLALSSGKVSGFEGDKTKELIACLEDENCSFQLRDLSAKPDLSARKDIYDNIVAPEYARLKERNSELDEVVDSNLTTKHHSNVTVSHVKVALRDIPTLSVSESMEIPDAPSKPKGEKVSNADKCCTIM